MDEVETLRAQIRASSNPADTIESLAAAARASPTAAERAQALGRLAAACDGEHDVAALRFYQAAFKSAPEQLQHIEASQRIYERLGKPEMVAKLEAIRVGGKKTGWIILSIAVLVIACIAALLGLR